MPADNNHPKQKDLHGEDKKGAAPNLIEKLRNDFSGKFNRVQVLDDVSRINLNAFLKNGYLPYCQKIK